MISKPALRAILMTAALSLATAAAVARSTDLQEPPRSEVVAAGNAKAPSPSLVRRAIIKGGAHHGWRPVADNPGVVSLSATSGSHEVSVDVRYDATGFEVKFKSSANMNEEKSGDKVTVHPKVNKWLADLNDDIRGAAASELALAK